MTEIKAYKVTDEAVQYVAGRRVPDDRIIRMTEAAARYDVMAGVLEPADVANPVETKGRKVLPTPQPVEG